MFLFAFIARPVIVGYSAYQKVKSSNYSIEDYGKNIQELKTNLLIFNANLSSCMEFNKKLLPELEKYLDRLTACKNEMNDLKINLSLIIGSNEENIKNLKEDLDEKSQEIKNLNDEKNKEINKLKNEKEEEINNLRQQYDLLAQNTANNLCCKAKIDNPKIKYYKIENNRIICMEDGTSAISC
ncbi:hypothetical protein HYX00_06630 [Candidatus Woesearchaeota archaeon]|nr:hypothetical protein [Candidatus Woesearchaeota archaeon]